MDVEYFIEDINFKTFGIYVSESRGITDRLKRKKPLSVSWDHLDGEVVDLSTVRYEPREIELTCFIEAVGADDFITNIDSFFSIFDNPGTQTLRIEVGSRSLTYEVYSYESVTVNKRWDKDYMVGTFTIKLIEPNPVKRV